MARTLLAIESSTDWLSLALLSDEEVIAFEVFEQSRQHASALLPGIDALLTRTDVGLDDLDAIGIATGPGSFTGLRIGLATVKGLALGREISAIGVSTLEAMAFSILEGAELEGAKEIENASVGIQAEGVHEVVALLDARRDEWYAGGWSRAEEPGGLPIEALPEGLYSAAKLIEGCACGVWMTTPDTQSWRRTCEEAGRPPGFIVQGKRARPRADAVGRLAARRLSLGQGIAVSDLEARYVRRAEAEAKRLGAPVETGEVAHLDSESPSEEA
ncbi:MAG TPA: tRNA (adenosine(37)-N6)-threonylcarbamoyltransferase complex dimerization subunit type 1 TsaB [Myxococcales bacterium]|nr:tRNA (adenosine(37)-N6)-threonylcarbamoyltransferase complex dimerization subunit type 1 TsaB [Myxococcales bacterium]HIK84866.1 tRNA (adenosine(37)-N6)-threonylcarbamoyltransferase complex dimerization subunit type 1 TsaB [Myxococcales bacterium]